VTRGDATPHTRWTRLSHGGDDQPRTSILALVATFFMQLAHGSRSSWIRFSALRRLRKSFTRQLATEVALLTCPTCTTLLACGLMQYVHGVAAQIALFLHTPAASLHDVGFMLVPELKTALGWAVSEWCTAALLMMFVVLLCAPFLQTEPSFAAVHVLRRTLVCVSCCQLLRILCFSSTQLPGPGPHCRLGGGSKVDLPAHWTGWVVVDVGRQASRGCGDLVFSSHVTWGITFVLAIRRYSASQSVFFVGIAVLAAQLYGIIAARKHYSLDLVVALFTVPLVWDALSRRILEGPSLAATLPR